MHSASVTLVLSLAFLSVCLLTRLLRRSYPAPYPPGPKGLPIVGNIFDMPSTYIWRKFSQWRCTYGDIVYVNIAGQPVVILNTAEQAKSLLCTKSSIYSDRPVLQMGKLVGWSQALAMVHYGQSFHEQRRYIGSYIGSKASVMKHHEVFIDEQRKFLKRLLGWNGALDIEIRRTATAITLRIAYGYIVQRYADPMVTLVEKAVETLDVLVTPGLYLVEILPFLRHLPSWFPGSGFKKTAVDMRNHVLAMLNVPYNFTKEELARNADLPPNFVAEHLGELRSNPEAEDVIKWVAASIFAGGADPIVSAMHSFILAMTLYPEVQKRAQAEIDAAVGDMRLPSLKDREKLPFVEAIVKEVLRWRCPAPLIVVKAAHRAMEDDIHEGYFIPKGATIFANIWEILHDPTTYPDPDNFDPDRFMTSANGPTDMPHPYEACFGYGRRRCPGINFADTSLFGWCAMMLAVYNISEARAPSDGKVLHPSGQYTSSAVSHPKPFKCSIVPRSEGAKRLVLSVDLE